MSCENGSFLNKCCGFFTHDDVIIIPLQPDKCQTSPTKTTELIIEKSCQADLGFELHMRDQFWMLLPLISDQLALQCTVDYFAVLLLIYRQLWLEI